MAEILGEENQSQSDNSTNEIMQQVQGQTFSQFMSGVSSVICFPKCMKVVAFVVFLGFVFLFGFLVGNWNARKSHNSPAARIDTTPQRNSPASTPQNTQTLEEEEEEEDGWERSKDHLVNLGCVPRLTSLPVPIDTIHGHKHFKPTHLVVERCLSNYSFCGKPRYGEAEGMLAGERCLPTKQVPKDFPVMYFNESGQKVEVSVSIEVHEECTCDNGNW
ncbi:hypothetical protein Pcinc_033722 [Petrolisthes cinctipes]|uniref:Uncharacterized protein n=1 Tax=Petrolisthes cinctipes TaxID=88211 RepID=A0AAE1ERL6_PETCI|nr:hypothetical protein Pcinc_033722 [Petrolisthes cinctipes]